MHPRSLRGSNGTYFCQIPGCTAKRKAGHLMCAVHWFQVPPDLRDRVNERFSSWMRGFAIVQPYVIARLQAIIYVGKLHSIDVSALEAELAVKEKTRP